MDTGNKTLAQLSEEGKEAKYVTLDVGSKLSGYTKEYLERLCSMRKVDYLLWNNEQHVIELKSLLNETHTILLSYEGLTFVDKAGLSVPPQEPTPFDASETDTDIPVGAPTPLFTPIPHFAEQGRLPSRDASAGSFSFTGRAVVSDSRHPENTKDEDTRIPVLVFNEDVVAAEEPIIVHTSTPQVEVQSAEQQSSPAPVPASVVHIPITQHREPAASSPTAVPVSIYHPIQTSVDATQHHETLPLFPELLDKSVVRAAVASDTEKPLAVRTSTTPTAESLPRVVTVHKAQLPEPIHSGLPLVRNQSQLPMREPNNLPERAPEHHLLVPEAHPLMKNVGFNLAFALLFVTPAYLVISGTVANNPQALPTGASNLAAIGMLAEPEKEPEESTFSPQTSDYALEFSDEVVVTTGDTPHSVLVQPIFRDNAGTVHEYTDAIIEGEGAL